MNPAVKKKCCRAGYILRVSFDIPMKTLERKHTAETHTTTMNTRIRFSALLLIASTVLFASCQKSDIEPQAPAAQQKVVKTDAVYNAEESRERPPMIIK